MSPVSSQSVQTVVRRRRRPRPAVAPESAVQPAAQAQPEPSSRSGGLFWLGLVLVWIFAAGFLQFARLPQLAVPPAERVNDGAEPTFFALHINPYYVFSEDFHLYVVRSKRILDRGWTDALLWSREDARPNYSAPLQAALMMLALQTDGRPGPYSLFIFGVLGVSWSILYVAAARWLPPTVSPLTVPIAVLVTVLFESIGGLVERSTEFGQWPVHRGLRMATLAWSNPLVLALVIALVSLLFVRHRPWGRIVFAGLVLVILALADTWAFLLGGAATAVVLAAALGLYLSSRRKQLHQEARSLLLTLLALSLAAATALALNRATSTGMEGDSLTRAGFGEKWRESPLGVFAKPHFKRQLRSDMTLLAALGAITLTHIALRSQARDRRLELRLEWRQPDAWRLYLLTFVAVVLTARAATVTALAIYGMDHYSEHQFAWRTHYLLLFPAVLLVSEVARRSILPLLASARRVRRLEYGLATFLLASLLTYHNVRIHGFLTDVASREFFVTADAERLRDWLREREPTLGRFTLATASHELNHLCAYWTNADLLLPEGFPIHDGSRNADLEKRMAETLAVYNATPDRWRDFLLHRHVWDQWSWAESRLLSARHGYMYYLMHNEVVIDGNMWQGTEHGSPRTVTRDYAERFLHHEKNLVEGNDVAHRAGVAAGERIAEQLARRGTQEAALEPDVIIVDEVSRALGTPALTNYECEFRSGSLEAWVHRKRSHEGKTPPPASAAHERDRSATPLAHRS